MTSPGWPRWFGGVAVVAALAVVALVAVGRRRHDQPPAATAGADADQPAAPYHQRRRFPNVVEEAPAPASPVAAEAPAAPPSAEVAAPLPPATPIAGAQLADNRPPAAPAQTASQWITGYRDAVCGCKTRGCVRDLQARFLNTLGTTNYAAERDQDLYVEASRAAIACYAALPQDS